MSDQGRLAPKGRKIRLGGTIQAQSSENLGVTGLSRSAGRPPPPVAPRSVSTTLVSGGRASTGGQRRSPPDDEGSEPSDSSWGGFKRDDEQGASKKTFVGANRSGALQFTRENTVTESSGSPGVSPRVRPFSPKRVRVSTQKHHDFSAIIPTEKPVLDTQSRKSKPPSLIKPRSPSPISRDLPPTPTAFHSALPPALHSSPALTATESKRSPILKNTAPQQQQSVPLFPQKPLQHSPNISTTAAQRSSSREILSLAHSKGGMGFLSSFGEEEAVLDDLVICVISKKRTAPTPVDVKRTDKISVVILKIYNALNEGNIDDYGLFDTTKEEWLDANKTIGFYSLTDGAKLAYQEHPDVSSNMKRLMMAYSGKDSDELVLLVHTDEHNKKGLKVLCSDSVNQILDQIHQKLRLPEREHFGLFCPLKAEYLQETYAIGVYMLTSPCKVYYRLKPDAPIHMAIVHCTTEEELLRHLEATRNPHVTDVNRRNLLHLAALSNCSENVVKWLIRKKVDLTAQDIFGQSVLSMACECGAYKLLQQLMLAYQSGSKIDLTRINYEKVTALHYLCGSYQQFADKDFVLRTIEQFGEAQPSLLFARTNTGTIPLHWAAQSNAAPALRYFLSQGVHPSIRDFKGNTPLHVAAMNGSVDAINILVRDGAIKEMVSNEGYFPLDLAWQNSHVAAAAALSDFGTKTSEEIFHAISDNDSKKLSQLLTLKQVDAQKQRGKKIVEQAGAWCAARGKLEMIRSFVELPAVVKHCEEEKGLRILWPLVTFHPPEELFSLFEETLLLAIHLGDNINDKLENGDTALHRAVISENVAGIEILHKNGAFLNGINNEGQTELHLAVKTGNTSIVNTLLISGCDTTIKDSNGEIAARLAERIGRTQIAPLLVQETKNHSSKAVFEEEAVPDDSALSFNITEFQVKSVTIKKELGKKLWVHRMRKAFSKFYSEKYQRTADHFKSESAKKTKKKKIDGGIYLLFCCMTNEADMATYLIVEEMVDYNFSLREMDETTKHFQIGDTPMKVAMRHQSQDVINVLQFVAQENKIYLQIRHFIDKHVYKHTTSLLTESKEGEFTPIFAKSVQIALKDKRVYNRDFRASFFVSAETEFTFTEGSLLDICIGYSSLIIDPQEKEVEVPIISNEGLCGSLCLVFEHLHGAPEQIKSLMTNYKPLDVLDEVKEIKKFTKKSLLAEAKVSLGYKPKYPVIIIPGLASSALESWKSDKMGWQRERVWVDPFKIGKAAVFQKFTEKLSRKKKDKKEVDSDEEEGHDPTNHDSEEFRRKWLQYMVLGEDGFSDPPGVKVRPVLGLHGCDYLSDQPLVKPKSYVFGFLINALCDIGYDAINLEAMPYDWRLPPSKLNERDGYFTRLKSQIEVMRELNHERVVLMAHSMGNRCVQYFLRWALQLYGQDWIDENVHAFLALGPPFIGAPKCVRAVISGDTMDLEVFLTEDEGKNMCRRSASLPWLFPIREEMFPDIVGRVKGLEEKGARSEQQTAGIVARAEKRAKEGPYTECNLETIVSKFAPRSWRYFKTFYEKDSLYLARETMTEMPSIMKPPPVKNLWVVHGVNLNTEVSYYYKKIAGNKGKHLLILDTNADRYSSKKLALNNPRGLYIDEGIAFETRNTYQPASRSNKSGDGTVPYCSLSYAVSSWKGMIGQPGVALESILTIEIDGAEHRAMLTHEAVFDTIFSLVCSPPNWEDNLFH